MRFVRFEKLVLGDRIANPIFDRKGTILYEAGTKLTQNVMVVLKNAGVYGIYVLEQTEPVKPLTANELELKKFQYVYSYVLSEEIKEAIVTHRIHKTEYISDEIIKTFCSMKDKLSYSADVKGKEDFVYRHSLNSAILAALIMGRLGYSIPERKTVIHACLFHDIGKTLVPKFLLDQNDPEEMLRIFDNSQDTGFELIETLFQDDVNVERICAQAYTMLTHFKFERDITEVKAAKGTDVFLVAETFEMLTSMNIAGTKDQKSQVAALRYLYNNPTIFNRKVVDTLVKSIKILEAGTSVLLNNGNKALVISENTNDVLCPMVLEFNTNKMIDLSNSLTGNVEIVDVVEQLDNRYSMK